ncbi:chemokine XC receptor 1-like [Carassius gibelio]|uniref:chemokine XC receptor 1-like n=1 Tax=Carassius gibelio TaxID=101364 RepID=UPI002277999A|nr:chemokine XC receptor 1-like [Carassius gibelio]
MTEENTIYPYDYYELNYSEPLCSKEEVVRVGSILIPLYFTLLVVLSCICNILVLVFLLLYKSLRCLTNVFILNLAVADLLFTFGLPFWASYYIWGWTFGNVGCKAVKFLFYLGFYSSVLFLTLMTVQRYMAVVHPLSDWERCRGLSVSPFIVWILSGIVALISSLQSEVMIESDNTYCEYGSVKWKSGIAYFQNAFFFIAFVIMCYCYGRMLRTISKSFTNNGHNNVKLTFFFVLMFFIGWAPYNVIIFLKSQTIHPFIYCDVSIKLDYAYFACRMLAFSHCCINPAILVFVDARFRNILQAISRRFCVCL